MSMEQRIRKKEEHRKPYRGAKAVDKTCRNHGSCPWCKGNRLYNVAKKETALKQKETDVAEKQIKK